VTLAAIALTGLSALGSTQAFAQFGFGYEQPRPIKRAEPNKVRTTNVNTRAGATTTKSANKNKPEASASVAKTEGPLVLSISLRRQRIAVYDANGLVTEAPISSGRIGYSTPTGVFSILQKNRVHFSNLYDSAPMPNMQRITWSGVALHAGQLPGYPASHGCIRLPHAFSKRLFEMTKLGTRVIVTNDPVVPVPFKHERLFGVQPPEVDADNVASAATHALMPSTQSQLANVVDRDNATTTSPVDDVIGIPSAYAAASPAETPIARLRSQRRAELARLEAAIAQTEAEKIALVDEAQAALEAVDAAKAVVRDAKLAFDRLTAEARAAARARDEAEKKLENFERNLSRKTALTPDDVEQASDAEDTLEQRAMDLDDAAERARQAAEAAESALAEAQAQLATSQQHRAAVSEKLKAADAAIVAAREADAAAKRRESKRTDPIHVFISRKTGKIYARQGYEPLLEAPVKIRDPDRPMGTHVFTALTVDPTTGDVTWNVTSIPSYTPPKATQARDRKLREAEAEAAASLAAAAAREQTPQAALARIEIPAEIRLQIEDVMKAGSSLIVSDNGLSNETGKFTDFIVPVR
jgi:lipoprotein-anchoring transpeptidase ErfK/SrfK